MSDTPTPMNGTGSSNDVSHHHADSNGHNYEQSVSINDSLTHSERSISPSSDLSNDCKVDNPTDLSTPVQHHSTLQSPLLTPQSAPSVLLHSNQTPPATARKRALFTSDTDIHIQHITVKPTSILHTITLCINNELCVYSNDSGKQRQQDSHVYDDIATVFKYITLPFYFEKLMTYATLLCANEFLNVFIVLPLRLVLMPFVLLLRRSRLTQRHKHDMIKCIIIVISLALLYTVHMSRIYHYIRGQNTLKLYVIYNMLQITDKLLCSAGEDIVQHTLRTHTSAMTQVLYIIIAVLYNFLHSLTLYVCVITLNVSINSDDNSLFVLLISNNFTELKSVVFKRCDSNNLMQISLSDATERLQLILFLAVILVQNMTHIQQSTHSEIQGGDSAAYMYDWLIHAIFSSLAVYTCELCIDWIKHGYINKFNALNVTVYQRITNVLANDYIAACKQRPVQDTEYASTLSRRFGFSHYPMIVVVLRVLLPVLSRHVMVQMSVQMVGGVVSVWCACLMVKFAITYALTLYTVHRLSDATTFRSDLHTASTLLTASAAHQSDMYDSLINQTNVIDYDPKSTIQLVDVERYKMIKSIPT